jgi:hypothetical protein
LEILAQREALRLYAGQARFQRPSTSLYYTLPVVTPYVDEDEANGGPEVTGIVCHFFFKDIFFLYTVLIPLLLRI